MEIIRNNCYNNDIIFIDGHGSCGKSKISKLLEYFEGVEKSREDSIFYVILKLHQIGKLDDNTTSILLKICSDRILYNQMIGTNINFRLHDIPSILSHPYPLDYIIRVFRKDKEHITKIINREKTIFQNMTQNSIIHSNILFETFGDRLKIIYVVRHPSFIINSLIKSSFVNHIGVNPSNVRLTYKDNDKTLPTFASNNSENYQKMNLTDKTIMWVYNETIEVNKVYDNLPDKYKKNILFVDFDKFTRYPNEYCKIFESFIKRDPQFKINRYIRKLYPEDVNLCFNNDIYRDLLNIYDKNIR